MQAQTDKMSKQHIENLLNRTITDDYYAQVVTEVLLNLLEETENE